MSRPKSFKLFVTPNPPSKETLVYLNKHIKELNALGVIVHIQNFHHKDFNEDIVNELRKQGITRLPAMKASDGKLYIGVKSILDLFTQGLSQQRNRQMTEAPTAGFGGPATGADLGNCPDGDINNYWMRELYAGCDPKTGRMVPRKDPDEGPDQGDDIERRLRQYQQNMPAHRRQEDPRDRDMGRREEPQRRRPGRQQPPPDDDQPRRRPGRQQDPDDNIGDDDDDGYSERPAPRGGGRQAPAPSAFGAATGDGRGDDLDRKMLDAWLNNNPSE